MESRSGTSTTTRRWLVVLAVVVLHALFVYVVERMRAHQSENTSDVEASLVMVRVSSPRVRERIAEPAARRESSVTREQRAQQTRSPTVATEPSLPSETSQPRAIDWHANAARSAQAVVEGSLREEHRSFGSSKNSEPQEAAAPSVFGSNEPKHKLGDLDPDVHGDPAVWLNDDCYMTLDKRVQTARDWIKEGPGKFAPPEIVCLFFSIGRREPDGTLFEHIKKREEPPVPKAGIEMKQLPLPENAEEARTLP